ncbi:transmembrane protein 115 [Eupeodes corollae]|uniref:transmembrane protein 115 n=1 Tax=Eupeodes corollae TaxID=290404 RepID=UPI00248F75AC|nr:transmembrane protein 115 [Eupeodes corollae]
MATTRALNRNVPYLKQQFSALLKNTSPVITVICAVTTCGYLLSYSKTAVQILSVTPGYILPSEFWIWTAFTFCFIELHFYEVLVDVITVGLCGKMLEPLWGQMEMFKFFAITNLGVAILTTFYYLFVYMCTKNAEILFDVHIHGLAGYVAGICVAVRQIMPDHLIFKTRYGRLTNRNVPLTVLTFSLVAWLINILEGTYPAMFCSGLIVSWVYLRFYQWHPNGHGDSSESFTFASFFPGVMQPFIGILVNPMYLCCLKMGVVKPPAPPRTVSTSSLSSISISMPGVDPHDIERRRLIALKALSERLKSSESGRQNSSLPKSFPQPPGSGSGGGGGKHHHGHGHGHSHSHHSSSAGHSHSGGHSHGGAGHSHQHHHHGTDSNTPAFYQPPQHKQPAAPVNPAPPLATPASYSNAVAIPKPEAIALLNAGLMAIPMPAPPPPPSDNETLISIDDGNATSSPSK